MKSKDSSAQHAWNGLRPGNGRYLNSIPIIELSNYTYEGGDAMNASVTDLRYKMHDALKALDRNEKVSLYCRGKAKGGAVAHAASKRIKEEQFFKNH